MDDTFPAHPPHKKKIGKSPFFLSLSRAIAGEMQLVTDATRTYFLRLPSGTHYLVELQL